MKVIRTPYGSNYPFVIREVHELTTRGAKLVVVPDEQTKHELYGLALFANVNVIIKVLEPGKPLEYGTIGMPSPWHVNTDKHRLVSIKRDNDIPYLLFNCL